jgi:iron complex outermembrane receptor protein
MEYCPRVRHGVRAVLAGLLLAAGAQAEEPQGRPASDAQAGAMLEEVVVSAQRREERMQDVPIAVNAFSGLQATAMGITDTSSLNGKVPSLNVSSHGGNTNIFLRGVGSNVTGSNGEQAVAMYLDGVYIYSSIGNVFPLTGLERIEVLKGPQGTLFGRDATGGVVQVITKDPSHDPSGEVSLGYGNYETTTGSLYATGELTSNLAANIAVDFQNQGKGYGRNLTRNEDTYWYDDFSVRTKLLYTPSDDTKIHLMLSYVHNNDAGYNEQLRSGVTGVDGVVSRLPPYDTVGNGIDAFYSDSLLAAVQVDHDFSFGRLTSITAGRRVNANLPVDVDATPLSVVASPENRAPSRNVEEEIRLSAVPGSRINWSVGGFYFRAKAGFDPQAIAGLAVLPFQETATYAFQHTDSKSTFAEADTKLTQTTELTLGIRKTWETIKLTDHHVTADGAALVSYPNQDSAYAPTTFRIALDQKLTDDIMVYASFNRGTKSGGYNLTAGSGTIAPFLPETLNATEVGVKSQWLDNRLRFNIAGYYYRYKNLQVTQVQLDNEVIENAGTARLHGVDGDFEAVLTKNLTFTGNFGFSHGTYHDFHDAVGSPPSAGADFTFDASGNKTAYTPGFSGSLGLNYKMQTPLGDFASDASVFYSDTVYVSPLNRLTLPAYAIVNGSVTYTPPSSDRFSVRLWTLNLLDKRYFISRLETGLGDLQVFAPPRTFGITFSTKF